MRATLVNRPAAVRSRLTRLVALVLAVGQLVVAVAGWADALAERDSATRTHVEQDGTRLHYVHVEAQCALCAAHHLMARPSAPATVDDTPPLLAELSRQTVIAVPTADRGGLHLSRAPPATA